ncbi:MAG: radical SAM protein [Bacteroidales bacterium]|nr:radical SAM protein [Bacteroidales bacterium]
MRPQQMFSRVIPTIATFPPSRKFLTKLLDKQIYQAVVQRNHRHLPQVQQRKYQFMSSMLHASVENLRKGYISKDVVRRLAEVLVDNSFIASVEDPQGKRKSFYEQYGKHPPNFVVISPTQACNLNCTGCYASSSKETSPKLPWSTLVKMVDEVHDKFGSRFVTISGGEPFLYKSEGKTILDLFEKYDDMFFLMYTNGTLITSEMAKKLAKLGNVTPAISVEGFEKETDERRGKGTFSRILKAFENLRNAGLPFAVSATATSKNKDLMLTDEFYDYFLEEQAATFMWLFQFMPIGRGREVFDLVVQPQDRLKLYHKWEYLISEKHYCVADFWNSGLLTDGCIAYGRQGGYIYIDWNGNIMPCVFVPYYVDNIYELHKQGKGLSEALFSKFMKNGRKWQDDYGWENVTNPDNWLMPCSIRDHYENFRKNILTDDAKGEDSEAEAILLDEDYYRMMKAYDDKLERLTKPIWDKYFARKPEKAFEKAL